MPDQNSSPLPSPNLLAEETILADAGEAAGVFLHELGNVLNNLLLSARLLQRQLPEEHRERLTDSCRLITEVAGQMQQLARFRQGRRTRPYPVELNAVVQQAVEELGGSNRAEMALAGEPVLVVATIADVRRIVRLLVENALTVTEPPRPIRVSTFADSDRAGLAIEDGGPPLNDAQLHMVFEPFRLQEPRPTQNQLALAVCKNLARRLNGQLQAENLPAGGLRCTVHWPRAVPTVSRPEA